MTAPDLKPCPWCGGTDTIILNGPVEDDWCAVSCDECHARGPINYTDHHATEAWNARPTPLAEALAVPTMTTAAQAMLDLHDGFLSGADVDTKAAGRLHLAAAFGAQAFAVCPMPEARPGAMLRALLVALIDPLHPDLDYLRASNALRAIGEGK